MLIWRGSVLVIIGQAMILASGDHAGALLFLNVAKTVCPALWANKRNPVPSAFAVSRSAPFSLPRTNAIWAPSGDKAIGVLRLSISLRGDPPPRTDT